MPRNIGVRKPVKTTELRLFTVFAIKNVVKTNKIYLHL